MKSSKQKEEIVKILPAAQYEAFDKNIKMNTIIKRHTIRILKP